MVLPYVAAGSSSVFITLSNPLSYALQRCATFKFNQFMGSSSSTNIARAQTVAEYTVAQQAAAAAPSAHLPKKETVLRKKVDSAAKTGVLNLSDMKLKNQSTIWSVLPTPALVSKLKTLDLSGNDLKTVPVEVYQLVNIKSLFMSGCNIQYTNDLRVLPRLVKLKLDHNDLEVDKIGPISPTVTMLNLSFNHLTGIPAVLTGLVNLITLDLSSNRIESLYGIDALVALVEVTLDDNRLVELPESICVLVKLRRISLARNRIGKYAVTRPGQQSIPAALLENSELDHIDLSGNPGICRADVMSFAGVDQFLARRQALKDKNFSGGALTDGTLFGLE